MGLAEVGVALAWATILVIGWLGYQMLARYGRLLLRVEALEQQLGDALGGTPTPDDDAARWQSGDQAYAGDAGDEDEDEDGPGPGAGIPFGTVLHDFELPRLDGGQVTFSQTHGERRLLVFVNPDCPHSRALTGDLAAPGRSPAPTWPRLVVVSTGPAESQQPLFGSEAPGYAVLLQEEMEVGALFEVQATPMAYLVDEDGKTASPLVAGRHTILGLAVTSAADAADAVPVDALTPGVVQEITTPAPVNGAGLQNGLAAGSVAPDIHLPLLGGGELALGRFRGQSVLLVFMDPISPPCHDLAPRIQQLRQQGHGPAIVLISRRDAAANRAWADAHGLTVPIALQSRWEVSHQYGMLATPVGYLVDRHGAIAAPVAVGADAILELWASHSRTGPRST